MVCVPETERGHAEALPVPSAPSRLELQASDGAQVAVLGVGGEADEVPTGAPTENSAPSAGATMVTAGAGVHVDGDLGVALVVAAVGRGGGDDVDARA